ncbi:hypothetical protein M9H77_34707 [Catharanthus roseus]|uniref:Uncharacterized protein n=1 Tax=Catharanthus roseus TaxID=4058 RepID=A0ACB9ZP31_CATRO|nr:hypothetical protein M9H77_34707 [Catharanthus roseus]
MPGPVRVGHPGCPLRRRLPVTLVTAEADSEGVFRSTLRLLTAPRRGTAATQQPFICPMTVHLLCLVHLFDLISTDGFYRGRRNFVYKIINIMISKKLILNTMTLIILYSL